MRGGGSIVVRSASLTRLKCSIIVRNGCSTQCRSWITSGSNKWCTKWHTLCSRARSAPDHLLGGVYSGQVYLPHFLILLLSLLWFSMWSLYVGRPWGINTEDISVSRPPKELDKVRSKKWKPPSDLPGSLFDAEQSFQETYDPVEACADANISLCAMMRQLSKIMYVWNSACDASTCRNTGWNSNSYSSRPLSEDRLRKFAASMRADFTSWEQDLPMELRVDLSDDTKPYLPHVLQLQYVSLSLLMCFWL